MQLRLKINTLCHKVRRLPIRYLFLLGVLFVMVVYLVVFRQQALAYNYSGDTCSKRLIVAPGLFSAVGDGTYRVSTVGGWNVAGKQIVATSFCVTPVAPPVENSSVDLAYAPWGGWLGRFTYRIEVGQHPTVDMDVLKEPIPATKQLLLPISEPDTTFSYRLEANKGNAACEPKGRQISCAVPDLKLEQGSRYDVVLKKYFKEKVVDEATGSDLQTLSPLSIEESSIANDAVVYDRPKSITLKMNKVVETVELTAWQTNADQPIELEIATSSSGDEVTVEFKEDIPRQAVISLKASLFEAADGSTPLDKQLLLFKTSGGPRVTGVNVGSSGVMAGSQIVVTFDQELSAEQDLTPFVATGGGVALQARSGNRIIFSTSSAARCADISIELKPDIKNPYDVSGQSAWKYSGRMSCYTISTIGYSVQGRPINVYHFGGGGSSVVYTGAIHGSEASTKYLMDRWIQELDANPGRIPNGKRVIVVPIINPDGFTRGSRVNARNVDLNRNFGVSDWQKDIQHTNGSAFPGGGGEEPMSEPETRAIANFVAQLRPELVVSYHSIGGMVIANQAGQANARAKQYAGLSGYKLSTGGGGEFGYQITGTADDYYAEKLGVPSILIELGSHSYHQFERNQASMWAMIQ